MIDFFSSILLYRILQTRVNCQRWRELKQFLQFSCLDCTGDLLQLYCGIFFKPVILFTDKLIPSTDKLSFYYINVKYFKKSAFWYDNPKPFPENVWQNELTARYYIRRCFFVPTNRDKPPVWALFGLVGYEPPPILSRHTRRNKAR